MTYSTKNQPAKLIAMVNVAWAILLFACPALANVTLPPIISDHMVLKRGENISIWGEAEPGENITVTLNGEKAVTTAGEDRSWSVSLNSSDMPSGPFELVVKGKNQIVVSDVVVGQVWVASGQSNMDWPLKLTSDAEQEIASAANPFLRQFRVRQSALPEPTTELQGNWVVSDPKNCVNFTAVGYFFAKKLQSELKVPIGIISTSWGGTPCEAWTSTEAIEKAPDLLASKQRLKQAISEYPQKRENFLKTFETWLKETGRQDRPTGNTNAYLGVAGDWNLVSLPGPVVFKDSSSTGAVWLQKKIEVPKSAAGQNIQIGLPQTGAYPTVYWNGKQLRRVTYADVGPSGLPTTFDVPAAEVKLGENLLAVRFFAPVSPVTFTKPPSAGLIALNGPWSARMEFDLPALDAKTLAAVPLLPPNPPAAENTASFLFNGMINPLLRYAITGVIWYQGEANVGRAYQYRTSFPLMIQDWRSQWKQGDLPFYFCQLANYLAKTPNPDDSAWAELREAQNLALRLPHTGQAVLIDTGESDDIHPRNKREAGERLASIALAKEHGRDIAYSGPVCESVEFEKGKARLKFSHTNGGLHARQLPSDLLVKSQFNIKQPLVRNSPNSQLEGFAICGRDRRWVWADACIEGDSVVVWSSKVEEPVAVRYGWANNPTVNLYNGAGLPASPFRTDDFPTTTVSAKY